MSSIFIDNRSWKSKIGLEIIFNNVLLYQIGLILLRGVEGHPPGTCPSDSFVLCTKTIILKSYNGTIRIYKLMDSFYSIPTPAFIGLVDIKIFPLFREALPSPIYLVQFPLIQFICKLQYNSQGRQGVKK